MKEEYFCYVLGSYRMFFSKICKEDWRVDFLKKTTVNPIALWVSIVSFVKVKIDHVTFQMIDGINRKANRDFWDIIQVSVTKILTERFVK